MGDGYWFGNGNNYVTNNIATDINGGGGDVYSYGFDVDASAGDIGNGVGFQNVPTFQGADPSLPGQSISIDMNATPILDFSGNEVYGATPRGFATWWLGTQFENPVGTAGTLQNCVVWNQYDAGYFTYETSGLVLDGWTVIGDYNQGYDSQGATDGIFFGDYMTRNATVENCNIQNETEGIVVPFKYWAFCQRPLR